jgi:hypothetical protein
MSLRDYIAKIELNEAIPLAAAVNYRRLKAAA